MESSASIYSTAEYLLCRLLLILLRLHLDSLFFWLYFVCTWLEFVANGLELSQCIELLVALAIGNWIHNLSLGVGSITSNL